MSGGIRRAPRQHTHDQMPRAAARNAALSYRARGVLWRLLTNADDYSMTAEDLAREGKEGRGAVLTALKELRSAGYVKTLRSQRPNGRWKTETWVFESPAAATEVGFSNAGFPNVGFPADKRRKSLQKERQQKGSAKHPSAAAVDAETRKARAHSGDEAQSSGRPAVPGSYHGVRVYSGTDDRDRVDACVAARSAEWVEAFAGSRLPFPSAVEDAIADEDRAAADEAKRATRVPARHVVSADELERDRREAAAELAALIAARKERQL